MKKVKSNKERMINGFNILSRTRNIYEVWADSMQMFAICLSNASILELSKFDKVFVYIWQERENEYLRIINKYDKKEQRIFPQIFALLIMEYEANQNQDLLGELYMTLGVSNKNAGQFFTPYDICSLMARLSLTKDKMRSDIKNDGYVKVYDPTVGAGATLIAVANECNNLFNRLNYRNHVLFIGQDIDLVCANMAYIQISLLGLAGYIIVGDTLSEPAIKDLKRVWFTPTYFNKVWCMRRLFHNQDILGEKLNGYYKRNKKIR